MKREYINNSVIYKHADKSRAIEQLAEQLYETASRGFKGGSPWETKHFYHTLETEHSIVITASILEDVEDDPKEKIVGVLIASRAVTEADIYIVVVDEEFKQQGIAFQMFQYLMEYGRMVGITSIFLDVRVSNEPAIALYQSLHFKEVGLRKGYYSSPIEDAIVMEHQLKSTGKNQ